MSRTDDPRETHADEPYPAPDAPSAPLPATANPDPARGDTPEASDAADDVSQSPLRNLPSGGCGVCGGRLDRGHPDGACAEPTGHLVDFEALPDAVEPEAATGAGSALVGPAPRPLFARCQTHDRADVPAVRLALVAVAEDGDPGSARTRELWVCGECAERYAEPTTGIPPGRWRTGLHWGRAPGVMATIVEEGTGPADDEGRRPDDRLVGSLPAPDAAYVVEAVNGVRSAHARGQEIADQRDAALRRWRAEGVRMRAERDEARDEVERLRARRVTGDMVERAVAAFMSGGAPPVISDTDGMDGAIRDALEAALDGTP